MIKLIDLQIQDLQKAPSKSDEGKWESFLFFLDFDNAFESSVTRVSSSF